MIDLSSAAWRIVCCLPNYYLVSGCQIVYTTQDFGAVVYHLHSVYGLTPPLRIPVEIVQDMREVDNIEGY